MENTTAYTDPGIAAVLVAAPVVLRPEVVSDLVCEGDVGGGEQRVVPEGDVAWDD